LQYLQRWQLRVPQCEILLPNSGARGTIRAGQFSQITNVIQSGGEEGMWTFERYQRWIDQQKEWVRPAAAPAATTDGGIVRAAARVAMPAGRVPRASMAGRGVSASSAGPATDGAVEMEIDEPLDLEEIAALARKIERGTP
jgi:twitching motility protein PilT